MSESPHTARPSNLLHFACSVIVAASAGFAEWMTQRWAHFASIFESMVTDGVQGLPFVQRILLSHPEWWRGFVFGLAAMSLLVIWRVRNENRVLLTGVLTAVFLIGISIATLLLLNHTLAVVIEKFSQ